MKTQSTSRRIRQRGSIVLVVMIVLAVMTAILAANSSMLYSLDRELRMVEQRQLKKFNSAPARAQVSPAAAARSNPPR